MSRNVLVLATVSGFLDKFEKGNVKLLQEQGYVVHYAANRSHPHYLFEEKEICAMGVRIHGIDIARSPYLIKQNIRAFIQLLELIRRYEISVLHCHTPVGGLLGRLAGWYFGKKRLQVIYTAHGFHFYHGGSRWENQMYYLAEKFLALFTDILVVINREDKTAAERFHLRPEGKVYHTPGVGVDLQRFTPFSEKEKQEKREKLGLMPQEHFLVSVGELNENKNHKVVLRALGKMRMQGVDLSGIRYGICGEGFYRKRLEETARQMGIEEQVVFYGYCDKVEEILGCADAAIFPSIREGLGMAGLEALALGIPLVAADNRGTREYMEHGKNGFVCSPQHPEEFAEAIMTLLSMDERKRKRMERQCRKSALPFGREQAEKVMKQVYGSLAARNMHLERSEENERKSGDHQCFYGGL